MLSNPIRHGQHPHVLCFPAELQRALELELVSILKGPAFFTSERSRDFLRYVVHAALTGHAPLLKQAAIGEALFGRNMCTAAAVRVRAADVRRRLERHYAGNPPTAGLRIALPRGSYRPLFLETKTPVSEAV